MIKNLIALAVFISSCLALASTDKSQTSPRLPPDACVVLYVDPTTTEKVPLNHSMTIYYQSEKKNLCGQPKIVESKTGRTVNSHVFNSSFLSSSQSLFLNTYELLLDEDYLQPEEKYKLVLGDSVIAEFKTAQQNSFQGNYLGQEEILSDFYKWKDYSGTKIVPAYSITKPLEILTGKLVKSRSKEVISTVSKIMDNDLHTLSTLEGRYDVAIGKMIYSSADPFGREKNLSALVAYPVAQGIEYTKLPAIIYLHSWDQPKHSPSNKNSTDTWLAILAASQGFVFIAPDMLGYGDTVGVEPSYFILDSTGEQVRDAWIAARSYFVDQLASGLTNKIILVGGRRGAYNAIAGWIDFAKHGENVSDLILYSGIYNVPYLIKQVESDLTYQKQLARAIIKTYAYYFGTAYNISGASKDDLSYLYSLTELNGILSQNNALDYQSSKIFIYENSAGDSSLSALLGYLSNSEQATPITINKIPCYKAGLEKLVKLGILNLSTVCSYQAWDSLLKREKAL
ncbi:MULTISPECIES: alpha/beta hydrolase family protein [Candidatus Ichthyocystis]|uniref:alpha/beta hydrolase family protein n=1 Tax=Candidatus Ichthyocystis TaxID=2929841 RepID=UPI001112C492|nr:MULTISPECIES: alpha/beta hydrolase [Ichthyocystis]